MTALSGCGVSAAMALLLILAPLAPAQVTTRTEVLEVLRRDKIARLWPERQSQIVNMANDLVERGLASSGNSNGFQPVILGGTRSGHGFSYGVGYQRTDLWRDRVGLRVTARATIQKAFAFDFAAALPQLLGGRSSIEFYSKYENSPQMDYYGSGPDTLESDRSSYRLEDTEVDVRLGYELTRRLSVGANVGGYLVNTGPGQRGGVPSADEVFDVSEVPGLQSQTNYFRWGGLLRYDYRDRPSAPTRGGHFLIRFSHYSDRTLRENGFIRLSGFAEHYFPYYQGGRVVALRLEAQTAFTDSSTNQHVPFYLQPTLGGNARLRGFSRYRFYDATSVLAIAEHRWYVFAGLDAAAFAEAGKVAPRNGLLNFSNLEWSAGLSLRFKILDDFFMRFDNAFSNEGYRMIFTFSDVFGREDPW